MQRCPVCHARFDQQTQCGRCATDLSVLIGIDSLAQSWERIAVQQLAAGNLDRARHAIVTSQKLQKRSLTQALAGFIRNRQKRRCHYWV